MLGPCSSDPNYKAEKERLEKEIRDGGVTSFGITHHAIDIMKSPLSKEPEASDGKVKK